jgi:hypothetical protein
MMKSLAALCVTLFVAAPVSAQVTTLSVPSPEQSLTADTRLTLSVGLFGSTSSSSMPRILSQQTVNLPSSSLLQREVCVEFPGYPNASMTVMQVVLKSAIEASNYHSDIETVMPKQPLSPAIKVDRRKKLWVVYSAPVGQEATLRLYANEPPPAAIKATCTTRSQA